MRELTKARLAKLSYEPDQQIIENELSVLFGDDLMSVKHFRIKKTDTEGFVVIFGTVMVFACCGTESFKDLMMDLKACRLPYYHNGERSGSLHRGFRDVKRSLQIELKDIYYSMYHPSIIDKVEFLGHSLGGFVAQACADLFLQNHINHAYASEKYVERITTWGCPGGWSQTAAREFDERHPIFIRYENPWDIVTKIPLTGSWAGRAIKLPGRPRHGMDRYLDNMTAMEKLTNR